MTANEQKLRVAVTKTSAQGKAAQSATPNLMSFSTDENSVWFNGKKYGVHKFNNVSSLNTNSTAEQVLSALNVSKSSELYDLAHKGVLFIDTISGNMIVKYEDGDGTFQLYVPSSDSRSIKKLTITVSSNKVTGLTTISHLIVDDIRNTLTSTETNKALSAAMGKKLNDEKLAKTDVVNNLTTTDTSKALSAAQGKKLNDEKLAKTDVVNNLTTTDTSKALSAAQGKALNDKISALGSVYRVKGSKTDISEVLALTNAKVGDAWNVTNAFTFGGKPYPANTNVVCLVATSTSDHDENNWDPIGGTVDLSPYAKKTEVEESDNEIWEQLNVVVNKDEIVNNLTSTNTDKPLSAAMGKKLQDEKLSKTDANNTYLTKKNAESTYAKKADGISHYNIGELTALNGNPTQEQLKTALGTPSAFRNAIDAGKLILVTGHNNIQSQKSAVCIIDSGNVIVKYLHPGNNDWTVIAKCVPASSGDNWDNAQFSIRTVKPSDSAGITIE